MDARRQSRSARRRVDARIVFVGEPLGDQEVLDSISAQARERATVLLAQHIILI